MRPTIRGADVRTVHAWDGFVLFWVVFWIVLGAWTGITLWQAADTGDTISASGGALHTTGSALQGLGDLPLVGERSGRIGDEVVATADDISARGQLIKGQLRRLAILQGIAIIGIPIAPVAGFYVPLRLSWRREVLGVQRALAADPEDPELDRYLAERARAHLPYAVVAGVRADGAAGSREPDGSAVRRLADLELARLGIHRPTRV